jgi:hypothetical protein
MFFPVSAAARKAAVAKQESGLSEEELKKLRKKAAKAEKEGEAAPDPPGYQPQFKWVCKAGLLPAGKDGQGHFRRVNCKVGFVP